MKTPVPRTAGTNFEPGNNGAMYPNQRCTSLDQNTTGIVRAKLSQNLSRNMATECPAWRSWPPLHVCHLVTGVWIGRLAVIVACRVVHSTPPSCVSAAVLAAAAPESVRLAGHDAAFRRRALSSLSRDRGLLLASTGDASGGALVMSQCHVLHAAIGTAWPPSSRPRDGC
jgi:hypothetical protein